MTHPPQLSAAVDCVVFGLGPEALEVLLVRRGVEPHRDRWALPGGLVLPDESVDDAARRELDEEAGVRNVFLEQLYTFGAVDRDPRGRVISIAYYALVDLSAHPLTAATDATDAAWFALDDLPPLAFDHETILETARARLVGKVRYQPIGFELLPEKFTLSQLQRLYEKILERPIDKRNFRRKVLAMGILVDLDEIQQDVAHRAARLYRFDEAQYRERMNEGFHFEL